MNIRREWKTITAVIGIFLVFYYLPLDRPRFTNAVMESLYLAKWYAREHVILCLVPAFFIAGAIAVFVSQASVMKYLGARANKVLAYGVASVSGTVLAVCSCTVLPLFSGIYRMGAGLGPATAFLYSGPAINVLAIVLTARILGIEMGIARAAGAILFSIVIGLSMHLIFRKEELVKANAQLSMPEPETDRPLWQEVFYFASMVSILVFANWGRPQEAGGLWQVIYTGKWMITAVFAVALAVILGLWFSVAWWKLIVGSGVVLMTSVILPGNPIAPFVMGIIGLSVITLTGTDKTISWFDSTWEFARQILPLLLFGVLIAGLLLGRPDHEGIIPSSWVSGAVGGNSLSSNFVASFVGAFMYFATLTEVPILQGLIGSGMGKGPALALLLAGPALSLPNMLVIRSVMGTKKTVVFIMLVVIMATISGIIYGTL
ncbi:permease [Candidatus Latescibacterota bacterium]